MFPWIGFATTGLQLTLHHTVPVSGGSCTVYSVGRAVHKATIDLKGKVFQRASELLKVPIDELEWVTNGIRIVAYPDKALTLDALYRSGASVEEGTGGLLFGQGSVLLQGRAPVFADTIAQVAVDPETGFVRLERLVTAQDTGTSINPLSVEGQIQGAASQSIRTALSEEVQFDQGGWVLNTNLLDYRMPTAADLPHLETILVDVPAGDGPFGAKGVGEPPVVSPVAAAANVVSAAIGIRMTEVPITPERIWRAQNEKGKQINEISSCSTHRIHWQV